jgi:hypothetical protein
MFLSYSNILALNETKMNDLSTIADIFSLIGFPMALVGLAITIYQMLQIKSAAFAAKKAAEAARNSIKEYDLIIELSSLITEIKFITVEHLKKDVDLQALYPTYTQIRQKIAIIRTLKADLSHDQNLVFQELVTQVRVIQTSVEKSNPTSKPFDIKKVNAILLDKMDELSGIMAILRNN